MSIFFKYLVVSGFLLFALSCGKINGSKNKDVLVAYKGVELTKEDIPEDILNKFSEGDSLGLLKSYIDKWLENQILINAAEENLSAEEKNKDKLINDYRNSLLIFEFHQKLVNDRLDTAVSEKEILDFYTENSNNFVLKKNIVKIRYLKIPKKSADLVKIKKLLQNPSSENDESLKRYAEEIALNFYLDSNWLYLDDITKEIPLNENYNQQRFLSNNKYIQLEENDVLYLLYIIDFRIKNSPSPIEFEKEKVKDILLYNRKLKLLTKTQEELFKKALEKGDIKYYLK
ncbi:MAG: hypothetical protein Q8K70_06485 [Bacteroidota bacterium]|nr:hypothetical protein [Bacteroidota bacterium]